MMLPTGILSFTFTALLLVSPALGVPQYDTRIRRRSAPLPRQDSTSPPVAEGVVPPTALLEPIVPPQVDENALAVLKLATNVTLAWAGSSSTNTTNGGQFKRDGDAVMSQAKFQFRYPTVPLDHSNFVSGLSCASGKLTGRLTSSAYTYAKKQWSSAGPKAAQIVFITSVPGCGPDAANEYFLANKITFSDLTKTFTAQGKGAGYLDITQRFSLQWGNVGIAPIKRGHDKREMFESHPLWERGTLSFRFPFEQYLDNYLGVDSDAPWDNAVQLIKIGKEDGKPDESWKKGEAKQPKPKKWTGPKAGSTSGGVDYGLKFYCVKCGFGGYAEIYGTMDVEVEWDDLLGIIPVGLEVTKMETGLNFNLNAGLNVGMEAYVLYRKEYEKELARVNLAGWEIPLLADIGPFISLSVQVGAEIKASGTLLIGSNLVWDNINVNLNLLDSSKSSSSGWKPRFDPRAEVTGELKMEAWIGLPIKLGLGVNILSGMWEADASIVDTPKLVAEGKFAVSGAVSQSGKVVPDYNGGCYGIACNLHFENSLQAVLNGKYIGKKTFDIIKPYESEPFWDYCIGYKDPGIDSGLPDYNPLGTGSGAGLGGNGMNSGGFGLSGSSGGSLKKPPSSSSTTGPTKTATSTPTAPNQPKCTPDLFQVNPKKPAGISCNKYVVSSNFLTGNRPKLNKEFDTDNSDQCNYNCLITDGCLSAAYTNKKKCFMFKLPVKDIATKQEKNAADFWYYDKACYSFSTCPA